MEPALAGKELSTRSEHTRVATLRNRISIRRKELLENYVPLNPPCFDGRQLELNNALWAAFQNGNTDKMIRLVKNGADPHSLERRIIREESKLVF